MASSQLSGLSQGLGQGGNLQSLHTQSFYLLQAQLLHQAFATGGPVHCFVMHQDEAAVAGEPHVHLDPICRQRAAVLMPSMVFSAARAAAPRCPITKAIKSQMTGKYMFLSLGSMGAGKGLYFKKDTSRLNA